ncbi:hypothetical protein [Providencia sneebia]|uniref:Lipoprotein n=1 Tax=Providencia sneebia DSM 19967 TaxID=1141660 RepID=K8WQS4_9GAMM|nr:hypothetical protein [Providencia sneebia]EKT58495.1 hypothetical protein OO7_07254 [Providencia sneebia DSM 19967]
MKKLLATLVGFSLLSGCAVTEYNYIPDSHKISEPKVGSVNQVGIGEPLVRSGNMSEIDGIKVLNTVQIDLAYKVTPGVFKKVGSSDKGDFYMPTNTIDSGSVIVEVIGQPWESLLVKKETNELCVVTEFNVFICDSGAQLERIKLSNTDGNSFEQALIFNGKEGQNINVSYRKLGSNVQQQGFGNTIQYNLSESDIIAYKGVKLKVLDSRHESIKYEVLSNFSDN